MRIARALIVGKGIVTVNLGKDITSLDYAKFNDNEVSLNKKLDKEKKEDAVGISEFGIGKILYFSDGTYSGVVYASTQPLKGEWTVD